MWLEKSEPDEMETQSSPLRLDEKCVDGSQVRPFLELLGAGSSRLLSECSAPLPFTLLVDTPWVLLLSLQDAGYLGTDQCYYGLNWFLLISLWVIYNCLLPKRVCGQMSIKTLKGQES